MTDIQKIVTAYMVDATKELITKNKVMGLRASGKFERGLSVTVDDTGAGTLRAFIESEGHVIFMQQGRAANKDQSFQQVKNLGWYLKEWVKQKGIDVNPYAAAYKIVHEGIRVPNAFNQGGLVDSVINENWFQGLFDEIRDAMIEDIKIDTAQLFK